MKSVLSLFALLALISCGSDTNSTVTDSNGNYHRNRWYKPWSHRRNHNPGRNGGWAGGHNGGGMHRLTDKVCERFEGTAYNDCINGFESDKQ